VALAVASARPAGVDAHTGLEGPDGRKDPDKARCFAALAREALDLEASAWKRLA
jgi:phosphoribosylanthranilate isomerase